MILEVIFLVILGGVTFHLRGIWGHHVGGGLMGSIFGFGVGIVLDLSVVNSLLISFWLAFIWAISSMVGWANYGGWSRFIRGYLAYGMLPNFLLSQVIFPGDFFVLLEMTLIGGLGMGIGFGLSSPLLDTFRYKIKGNFDKKNVDQRELVFREPKSEEEVSHVHFVHFNTWTYLMEVPSGALYGFTTALILMVNLSNISIEARTLGLGHQFYTLMIFGTLVVAAFLGGFRRRKDTKLEDAKEKVREEIESKYKRIKIIVVALGTIFGLMISIFVAFFTLEILFLMILWITIISGRINHDMNLRMFQIDALFDIICGLIVSLLVFIL